MESVASRPTSTRQETDCDARAGALALQIAQVAATRTAQGGSRAAFHPVLRLLLEAVDATMVACYAGDGASLRRVAIASAGIPMTRSRMAAARRAAQERLRSDLTSLYASEISPSGSSRHGDDALLALPVQVCGHRLALVFAWPAGSAVAPEHVALLERLAPTLELALPPHLIRSARRAAKSPAIAPRLTGQPTQETAAIGRGVRRAPVASTTQIGATHTDTSGFDPPHAEFVALVSHELRTPLNTLSGFLEIVLDERVGTLTERQREFLGYASSGAAQLARVIEEMLSTDQQG